MLLGTRAVELRKTNGIYKILMEGRLIKTLLLITATSHCTLPLLHIANPLLNFSYQYFSYQKLQVFLYRGSLIFIGWFFEHKFHI